VLTRRGDPRWAELGAVAEIDAAVAELRRALADPKRSDAKALARALDERVMRPVRALVGDEPFAVILADDVIDATPPGLAQMIDIFNEFQGPVLAIEEVPWEAVSSYGIIDAEEIRPGVYKIRDMVEKPPRAEAPSNLAIIGRYILTPDIFPILEATKSDRTGEIQLTNGMRQLLKQRPIYGCRVDGVRHDTGNKLGFLKAVVYFALRRKDIAEPFREYLRSIDLDGGSGR